MINSIYSQIKLSFNNKSNKISSLKLANLKVEYRVVPFFINYSFPSLFDLKFLVIDHIFDKIFNLFLEDENNLFEIIIRLLNDQSFIVISTDIENFTFMTIAGHSGWLLKIWPDGPADWILGNGAFHSFASVGILATLLLTHFYSRLKQYNLIMLFLVIGVLFLIAGSISRNFFIISKIQATPTWIFLCCGIAFLLYAVIYWLVDIRGKSAWFDSIKVAGTSTLTCYLIPYIYYSIADLLPFSLPESFKFGAVGLLKSLLFAFLIIGITALLGKMKIKLKI